MTRTRRVILFIVLLFVMYAIYTAPSKSADTVHSAWNVLTTAVSHVFDFFNAVLNR